MSQTNKENEQTNKSAYDKEEWKNETMEVHVNKTWVICQRFIELIWQRLMRQLPLAKP